MKFRFFWVPAVTVLLLCIAADSADARPARSSRGRSHRSSRVTSDTGDKPNGYVGVYGNLMFFPSQLNTGSGIWNDTWQDFSGGMSVVVEGYVSKFFAIGGLFDVSVIDPVGGLDVDDDLPQISLDVSMRPLFPFGSKGQFEIYLRTAVGYTAFIPSRNALATWQDLDDSEHGWNVRLLPGFSFRASFGLTLSIEAGWVASGYRTAGGGLSHVMYHSPTLNVGIGYTF